MNRPRPFHADGEPPDVLAILDELERMRVAHQNDARRHNVEAERIGQMRKALLERFRKQLNRKRKAAAK